MSDMEKQFLRSLYRGAAAGAIVFGTTFCTTYLTDVEIDRAVAAAGVAGLTTIGAWLGIKPDGKPQETT